MVGPSLSNCPSCDNLIVLCDSFIFHLCYVGIYFYRSRRYFKCSSTKTKLIGKQERMRLKMKSYMMNEILKLLRYLSEETRNDAAMLVGSILYFFPNVRFSLLQSFAELKECFLSRWRRNKKNTFDFIFFK